MPPVARAAPRQRIFSITFNNPTMGIAAFLEMLMYNGARFCEGQHEIGEENHTPHLQVMVIMNDKKSRRFMRRLCVGCDVDFMHAESTKEALKVYVTKELTRDPVLSADGPVLRGVWPPGQGSHSAVVDEVQLLIRDGGTELDVADAHPAFWFRYYKACTKYRFLTQCDRSGHTHCTVYWGPAGSGKTRAASSFGRSICTGSGGDYAPVVVADNGLAGGEPPVEPPRLAQFWLARPDGNLWWDGYANQPVVVIDEFYGWIKRDVCQRMIDRSPWQVPVKGDFIKFNSDFVVFTSNLSPFDWWKNIGIGDAMKRRLTGDLGHVVYMGNVEFPTQTDYVTSNVYAKLLRPNDEFEPPLANHIGVAGIFD